MELTLLCLLSPLLLILFGQNLFRIKTSLKGDNSTQKKKTKLSSSISKCVFFSGCHNFYIIEVLLIKKNVLIKHQMTFIPFNLNRFTPSFVYYKKGCTRFASAINKVYQLLVQSLWFSSFLHH